MIKLTLENEYGIFAITEKDVSDASLGEMVSLCERLLQCAGYYFEEEES